MQSYILFFLHISFCFHFPKLVFPCVHTLNMSIRQKQRVLPDIWRMSKIIPTLQKAPMLMRHHAGKNIFYILTYWNIFNHDVHCSAFGEAESLILEKKGLVEEMDTLNRWAWTIFLSLSLRCTPSTVDVDCDDGHSKHVEIRRTDSSRNFLTAGPTCWVSMIWRLEGRLSTRQKLQKRSVQKASWITTNPNISTKTLHLGGASPLDGF